MFPNQRCDTMSATVTKIMSGRVKESLHIGYEGSGGVSARRGNKILETVHSAGLRSIRGDAQCRLHYQGTMPATNMILGVEEADADINSDVSVETKLAILSGTGWAPDAGTDPATMTRLFHWDKSPSCGRRFCTTTGRRA